MLSMRTVLRPLSVISSSDSGFGLCVSTALEDPDLRFSLFGCTALSAPKNGSDNLPSIAASSSHTPPWTHDDGPFSTINHTVSPILRETDTKP